MPGGSLDLPVLCGGVVGPPILCVRGVIGPPTLSLSLSLSLLFSVDNHVPRLFSQSVSVSQAVSHHMSYCSKAVSHKSVILHSDVSVVHAAFTKMSNIARRLSATRCNDAPGLSVAQAAVIQIFSSMAFAMRGNHRSEAFVVSAIAWSGPLVHTYLSCKMAVTLRCVCCVGLSLSRAFNLRSVARCILGTKVLPLA